MGSQVAFGSVYPLQSDQSGVRFHYRQLFLANSGVNTEMTRVLAAVLFLFAMVSYAAAEDPLPSASDILENGNVFAQTTLLKEGLVRWIGYVAYENSLFQCSALKATLKQLHEIGCALVDEKPTSKGFTK